MSRPIVSSEYDALLKKVSPKVIRTEKESQAYVQVLYGLDQRGQRLSAAEGVSGAADTVDGGFCGEELSAAALEAG